MQKIRLFAALEVPRELGERLRALPRKGMDSARFTHADDFHITLRFIGDVEETLLPGIESALEETRVKSFTVVAKGLDIFSKKNRSVLYVPIESARAVTHLSAEITDRLARAGLEFPDRFFTPHITVARMKNAAGLKEYAARHGKEIRGEWKAARFFLFRSSRADAGEPRYAALREYPLAAY